MIKIENIKIFQYGEIPNGYYIAEEVVKEALDSFIDKPIMVYNEDNPYNKDCSPVGIINKVNEVSNGNVYGDITLFNLDKVGEFKNFSIVIEDRFEDNGHFCVQKFTLSDISFSL